MSKREIERTVQPSLLDRLTDYEPRNSSSEVRVGYLESVRQFKAGLAARSRVAAQHPAHPGAGTRGVSRSWRAPLYHFGLPDLTSISRDSHEARERLLRRVEEALRSSSRGWRTCASASSRRKESSTGASCAFSSKARCASIRRRTGDLRHRSAVLERRIRNRGRRPSSAGATGVKSCSTTTSASSTFVRRIGGGIRAALPEDREPTQLEPTSARTRTSSA